MGGADELGDHNQRRCEQWGGGGGGGGGAESALIKLTVLGCYTQLYPLDFALGRWNRGAVIFIKNKVPLNGNLLLLQVRKRLEDAGMKITVGHRPKSAHESTQNL